MCQTSLAVFVVCWGHSAVVANTTSSLLLSRAWYGCLGFRCLIELVLPVYSTSEGAIIRLNLVLFALPKLFLISRFQLLP